MDTTLKRIITAFAAPFILSLILLSLAGVKWLTSPVYSPGQTPTIYVAGEAKVKTKPNVAEISFSVINQGSDPGVIQKSNDKKMKDAIDFLKSQGVKEDDIKTTAYNLQPQYEYDTPPYPQGGTVKPPRIVGYLLTQTVNAKIRDFETVGEIVAGLSGQGVNQINSISFFVDNPEPYKNQARQQAIAKARTQALETAGLLGVRLGRVVHYSESPYYVPGPVYRDGLGGGEKAAYAPIQPGIEEITISVNITYTIR